MNAETLKANIAASLKSRHPNGVVELEARRNMLGWYARASVKVGPLGGETLDSDNRVHQRATELDALRDLAIALGLTADGLDPIRAEQDRCVAVIRHALRGSGVAWAATMDATIEVLVAAIRSRK